MSPYAQIFLCALVLAIGTTPLAKLMALKTDFLDHPSAGKFHRRTMPLLGGTAIYLAFIGALVLFGKRHIYLGQLAGIVSGATIVSFLGLWDDRRRLPVAVKLAVQGFCATILAISGLKVGLFNIGWVDFSVTLVWIVVITNGLNLLDNMDGLSAGIAMVSSAFFLLIAAMNGQYLVGALAAALMGASLGFLVYNFNPASIFMGDGGSLFLGFILASVGVKLRFPQNVDTVTWMVPVIILGIPLFDIALVFTSRLKRGLNPFMASGKDHTSHRLVALGMSSKEAVLILYLVSGGLGMVSVFITQATVREGYALGSSVLLIGMACLLYLEKKVPAGLEDEKRC